MRLSGGRHGLRGHQSGQGNMHTVPRVIEVAYFKSEVEIDIEAIEAVWRLPWPQRPPKWLLKATCTYIVGC